MAAAADTKSTTEERAYDRSPAFPFISLEKALERVRAFEAQYKKAAGRITNVLPLWEYTAKSSGGQQTLSALKAFGLIEYEGAGADRKIKLTELALRILKDERPGKREEGIKEAALKPKPLAEHWKLWSNSRPPDAECRSELTLERGYTEDAAGRFLRVYDETIKFAKLAPTDSISDKQDRQDQSDEQRNPQDSAVRPGASLFIPAHVGQQKGSTMPERVVFSQEIEPPQAIKLLVTGPVDDAVLDALDDFVQFQRVRLKRTKRVETPEAAPQPASEGEASES